MDVMVKSSTNLWQSSVDTLCLQYILVHLTDGEMKGRLLNRYFIKQEQTVDPSGEIRGKRNLLMFSGL